MRASSTVYFPLCSFMCAQARWSSMLCISRYAYDVNITLHLLLLNTFRVCSFITMSVVIRQNELNRLSLLFAPQTEFSLLSEERVTSHRFNVFALTCGKKQINVMECMYHQQPANTPTSETLSASSVFLCCLL